MFCIVFLCSFYAVRSLKGSFKALYWRNYAVYAVFIKLKGRLMPAYMVHGSWPGAPLGAIYRSIDPNRS